MFRTTLTVSQRSNLHPLRRTDLPAVAWDRLEMVLLSDAGWSPPRVAEHLSRHPHTVRAALKGYAARGPAAFHPDAPGPDPNDARRDPVTARLRDRLGRDRTRTRRPLADALGPPVGIGHRQTRRDLAVRKAGGRRAAPPVSRRRDPAKAVRAKVVLGGRERTSRRAGGGCSSGAGRGSPRRSRPGPVGAGRGRGRGHRRRARRAGG